MVIKTEGNGRRYKFAISTPTRDLSGDTISLEGWDLSGYSKNGVVLAAHDAHSWPIGRTVRIGVDRNRLVAEMEFAGTRAGETARKLVDTGYLRGASVGFAAGKFSLGAQGINFLSGHRLLEWSLCSIPANPECLLIGASSNGKKGVRLTDRERDRRRREIDVIRARG